MIIGNKYELIKKIGCGSFGSIYRGKNIRTNENVAIKIESINEDTNLLKNETKIYQYLSGFNYNGIPILKWYGIDDKYNYMVINLLVCFVLYVIIYLSNYCYSILLNINFA